MGALVGGAAMMGVTGATDGTSAVCRQVACTEADCITIQNQQAMPLCRLKTNGLCHCREANGTACDVACVYCVAPHNSHGYLHLKLG